jgi:hypothetical protein
MLLRAVVSLAATAGISQSLYGQIPPSDPLSPADAKIYDSEVSQLQSLREHAGDKCAVDYSLARTFAAGGQYRKALSALQDLNDLNAGLDPSTDAMFGKLRATREFSLLMRGVREHSPPVANSRPAFTIDVPDLLPDGIGWDQKRKRFFLGSTWRHQIVECTPAGDCRPLVKEGQDGLFEVLGVQGDPRDSSVWAVSNSTSASGLYHFAAPSGELMAKYMLDHAAQDHLFNDLAVSSKGDVFVSDARAGAVYWVSHVTSRLEVFDPKLNVAGANGIALSSDDKTLYVAGFPDGITTVDVASKSWHGAKHPPDLCLGSIDSLSFFDGSLIAIQNGMMTPRVVRLKLTPGSGDIESFEVLERRNTDFDGITTGVLADGAFYFIANSQLDKATTGRLKPGVQLNPVKILRIDIKP